VAVFISGGSLSARVGGSSSLDGGRLLIQLHPELEDRYLSLDHYPSMDLGWQKLWLYVPNESPPLSSYSPDRLRGDLPESWEELQPLELYRHHVPNLLDAIKDLKDWGLTGMKVICTFIGCWGPLLEDEAPPLVGVPRPNGPYNRVEGHHPRG
jgi:hypothetical protein